jgi:surface polysaccharide O-acyltransferase-like enzyme
LVRKALDVDRVDRWLSSLPNYGVMLVLIAVFALLYITSWTQVDNPSAAMGLLNLYRPIFYFTTFLMGYYIFSSEAIHDYLASKAKLLILLAIMSATVFGIRYYGVDYTLPNVLQSPLCVLFCWTAIMAMLGGFKRWADRTTSFTSYMTRSSFGVYIVHMTICSATCILLKQTTLPVWSIYLITIAATFVGSFLLWEILRRVPFVRWCIFGIKAR